MYIPSYQIHNVLKVYSKQLSQSRILERQKAYATKPSVDKINISVEGKRQAVIDKVAAGIVDRITKFGPQDKVDHEIVGQLQDELGKSVEFKEEKENTFVFNSIDDKDQKTKNTVSVEDSSFLVQRLEQLAKEAVDKNMES